VRLRDRRPVAPPFPTRARRHPQRLPMQLQSTQPHVLTRSANKRLAPARSCYPHTRATQHVVTIGALQQAMGVRLFRRCLASRWRGADAQQAGSSGCCTRTTRKQNSRVQRLTALSGGDAPAQLLPLSVMYGHDLSRCRCRRDASALCLPAQVVAADLGSGERSTSMVKRTSPWTSPCDAVAGMCSSATVLPLSGSATAAEHWHP